MRLTRVPQLTQTLSSTFSWPLNPALQWFLRQIENYFLAAQEQGNERMDLVVANDDLKKFAGTKYSASVRDLMKIAFEVGPVLHSPTLGTPHPPGSYTHTHTRTHTHTYTDMHVCTLRTANHTSITHVLTGTISRPSDCFVVYLHYE